MAVYLPLDVEFTISLRQEKAIPWYGPFHEEGPSIKGPGSGQCAADAQRPGGHGPMAIYMGMGRAREPKPEPEPTPDCAPRAETGRQLYLSELFSTADHMLNS